MDDDAFRGLSEALGLQKDVRIEVRADLIDDDSNGAYDLSDSLMRGWHVIYMSDNLTVEQACTTIRHEMIHARQAEERGAYEFLLDSQNDGFRYLTELEAEIAEGCFAEFNVATVEPMMAGAWA